MRILSAARLIACICTLIRADYAFATKAESTFFDPSILRASTDYIKRMSEPELRVFVAYLADCADLSGDFGKHECRKSQSLYEIEFGANRPLDEMVYARSNMEEQPSDNKEAGDDLALHAINFGKVVAALHRAAADRFRIIRQSSNSR